MLLSKTAIDFLTQNYNYVWLKSKIKQAQNTKVSGSTLITGSSHALNGIYEPMWKNAINCSMHSQDIYYDFACAKKIIDQNNCFDRCFIVLGYYISYQDLSLSTNWGKYILENVYSPVLNDIHNWSEKIEPVIWKNFEALSEQEKINCEEAAEYMLKDKGYYNELNKRHSYFDLKGLTWSDLTEAQKDKLGKYRATEHNRNLLHVESFDENKNILDEFVHYLYQNDVLPIFVIPPFTKEYCKYVDPKLKQDVLDMTDNLSDDVNYIDFNDNPDLFDDNDFMDTDHMTARGAAKMSLMLSNMFGF